MKSPINIKDYNKENNSIKLENLIYKEEAILWKDHNVKSIINYNECVSYWCV